MHTINYNQYLRTGGPVHQDAAGRVDADLLVELEVCQGQLHRLFDFWENRKGVRVVCGLSVCSCVVCWVVSEVVYTYICGGRVLIPFIAAVVPKTTQDASVFTNLLDLLLLDVHTPDFSSPPVHAPTTTIPTLYTHACSSNIISRYAPP